jgi:DNA-binding NtrC family response regulator
MSAHQLLLVDDEPMILQSLSLLFEEEYIVHTATNGQQGLRILKEHPISVIIADQRMPKMTGIEFLRQAKEIAPDAMRILMTGYADLEAIIDSVNVGEVFRYVNKPWQAEKLRETVRFACNVAQQRRLIRKEKPVVPDTTLPLSLSSVEFHKSEFELLFVDSNFSHLKSFKEFFEPKYTCHISNSPDEALSILRRFPVAVLVSEANLGNIDGADFLIAAKAVQPEVVTILMTSIKDYKVAVRLINEGQIYRYLVKPFSRESLRLTIESAVIHYKFHREQLSSSIASTSKSTFSVPQANTTSLPEILASLRQHFATRPIY